MNGADIDDDECDFIASAVLLNTSITSFSMTNNLIGGKELLNVVQPSFKTGGESLGEMLIINSTLLELDLSWNFLRLGSATTLANSILSNSTLHTLKLAYNAFGDLPTQHLGKALKGNRTITYLDLSYNSIQPKAATVLANGLIYNYSLLKLIMDGNAPGHVGSQALVAAVQRASGEDRLLFISFSNCDCLKEDKEVFDAGNPGGSYRLDLEEPYGQMVAEELIYLANFRAGCNLKRLSYDKRGDSLNVQSVELIRPPNNINARNELDLKIEAFVKSITVPKFNFIDVHASDCLAEILKIFDLFLHSEVRITLVRAIRQEIYENFDNKDAKFRYSC